MSFFKAIIVLCLTFFLAEAFLRLAYNFSPQVKYFLYSSRYDLNLAKVRTEADIPKYAPCPLKSGSLINGFMVNKDGFYTPEYRKEKGKEIQKFCSDKCR